MPTKKKKYNRKVLKVNQEQLIKHLKVIATHGIVEQGSEKALQLGKDIFYYRRGNEKLPLSDSEVGRLIFN